MVSLQELILLLLLNHLRPFQGFQELVLVLRLRFSLVLQLLQPIVKKRRSPSMFEAGELAQVLLRRLLLQQVL